MNPELPDHDLERILAGKDIPGRVRVTLSKADVALDETTATLRSARVALDRINRLFGG